MSITHITYRCRRCGCVWCDAHPSACPACREQKRIDAAGSSSSFELSLNTMGERTQLTIRSAASTMIIAWTPALSKERLSELCSSALSEWIDTAIVSV